MNQRLFTIWLGEGLFCFSGELSEVKVDAWAAAVRQLELPKDVYPFRRAGLRLAELRYLSLGGTKSDRNGMHRRFMSRSFEGLALSSEEVWPLLLAWDDVVVKQQGIEPGEEWRYWKRAAQLALDLLYRGRIMPGIMDLPVSGSRRRGKAALFRTIWRPDLSEGYDEELFRQLAGAMPPICLAPVKLASGQENVASVQLEILYSFVSTMIDLEVRRIVSKLGRKLNPFKADYRRGTSPLAELWWNDSLAGIAQAEIQGAAVEVTELTCQIERLGGSCPKVDQQEDHQSQTGSFRLCLRLEPYSDASDERASQEENPLWKLSLWAEGVEEPAVLLPYELLWRVAEDDVEIAGRMYYTVKANLLYRLSKAAEQSDVIKRMLDVPMPAGCLLGPQELIEFLTRDAAKLRKHGVTVQMPSQWMREGRRSVGMRMKIQGGASFTEAIMGDRPGFGVEQLVAYEAEATLGGVRLTEEELNMLAASRSPVVFFRGEWIEIDNKEIRKLLKWMKRQRTGQMTIRELMHLATSDDDGSHWQGLAVEAVQVDGMLSELLSGQTLRNVPKRPVPKTLCGTLRPYQERGYQWLAAMRRLGFGALLADDMGLGKTVQVITALLDGMEEGKILIICPTSLLGNWQRELTRFAPEVGLYIHHGGDRLHGEAFRMECDERDVVLTTYPLAGRDMDELQSVEWATIVLDEAQYIKNYRTKQAQSVMRLRAPHRIAMTGTPVENRLSELWSIFQFLNPGYLGTSAAFKARYAAQDSEANGELVKLRKLVAPFLLRRLKSDPDIRKDLPEKIELKSYCLLSPVQEKMYREVTEQLIGKLDESTGIARKGLVLSSLTRLKQICDHPLLIKGGASRLDARLTHSGKMERLIELLDLIYDHKEAALIFTQYVQMGELICAAVRERYGEEIDFLHGGVAKLDRDKMVERFQQGAGSSVMVLSLKAGGVGLNLTRANHVIHYDRWWNPAVENQATDRVFRIGQKRNVEVHKLICQGTLEERIDELIERKKMLSEQVVGAGENWLTEMSDEELRHLIRLQYGG